uniref:Lipocalin n=1 Tax=Rhipicephalus zambeziensis TaxID=60191 RepID=A0A224YIQ3_9ACAR
MAPALMRSTASVLVLFLLAQVPASNCHKCRKLKSSITVDWSKLEKKLWIQALVDKPHGVTQCIARSYRGNQGKLYLRAVGGSDSQLWNITKEYSNGQHDKDTIRFPKLWPPHFYQILDTDYETYLVEHICNRYRADVVALMYHKPVKRIPDEVMKKASAAVLKSGLRDIYNMTTTDCMLSGRGISRHIKPWFEFYIHTEYAKE